MTSCQLTTARWWTQAAAWCKHYVHHWVVPVHQTLRSPNTTFTSEGKHEQHERHAINVINYDASTALGAAIVFAVMVLLLAASVR